MNGPIVFPYKVYRQYPAPIIPLTIHGPAGGFQTEAYVDSGAAISLFSIFDAERIGLSYEKGRKTHSIVGDGTLIPVYLHRLPIRIGAVSLKAVIGFSPRLGVGFNLLGRAGFFTAFDILFSEKAGKITFLPHR